jgi:death-on-curing protein
MRYLTLGEVVALHRAILDRSGGASGIRDLGALESALAQPRATFGGVDLHISLTDNAAALGFSLAANDSLNAAAVWTRSLESSTLTVP